jgi:hypothetical protein
VNTPIDKRTGRKIKSSLFEHPSLTLLASHIETSLVCVRVQELPIH